MTQPAGSKYTCANCRGTFLRASDDAAAIAEAARDFATPDASRDPAMAILCDDCYRAFMVWFREAQEWGQP
jgi:hypothetical protein